MESIYLYTVIRPRLVALPLPTDAPTTVFPSLLNDTPYPNAGSAGVPVSVKPLWSHLSVDELYSKILISPVLVPLSSACAAPQAITSPISSKSTA